MGTADAVTTGRAGGGAIGGGDNRAVRDAGRRNRRVHRIRDAAVRLGSVICGEIIAT